MSGGSTKNTGFSTLGNSGFMTSGNSAQQEKVKSEIRHFSKFSRSTDLPLCKREIQDFSTGTSRWLFEMHHLHEKWECAYHIVPAINDQTENPAEDRNAFNPFQNRIKRFFLRYIRGRRSFMLFFRFYIGWEKIFARFHSESIVICILTFTKKTVVW